ncbi:hypothetical protein [uncultured Sulfitobacter sp.]|uniref:hypothetical protein n=1 Tax=uncultured Sulfitobacter sp. TaxID=191468 RepID=UPI0026081A4D|nr:hypothetical protein [uncultured Sulfitobacter sp.]
MVDFFKELADAANARIRSPFLGSIFIVFLTLNWKAIAILIFSNSSIELRALTFEGMTSLTGLVVYPVVLGVIVALVLPWLKLLGAWIAKRPSGMLLRLQHDESQQFRIYKLNSDAAEAEAQARLDEATERAKIDAAKRLEDARQVAPDLEDEIKEERAESAGKDGVLPKSEIWKREVLKLASNTSNGQVVNGDDGFANIDGTKLKLSDWSGSHEDHKILSELLSDMYISNLLETKGKLRGTGFEVYEISADGYNYLAGL